MCGPWIPDLTKEESELLDRIYTKIEGGLKSDIISVMLISCSQEAYTKFD